MAAPLRTAAILKKYRADLLKEWTRTLVDGVRNDRRITEEELSAQANEFLTLMDAAAASAGIHEVDGDQWSRVKDFLSGISRSRAIQGFSSDQTAAFIFSFKKPLFDRLRKELSKDPQALADELWAATELIDKLGLHTVKFFQQAREEVITRQQEELLELSTPVVKMWDGILALPMIGTLDSARTQVVMETLLQRIVETGSEMTVIDITGVPTVDTLTAQHLMKTVAAIRMMGADCIISGIRPQIAQTIVHLGVDLEGITTRATLADALALALKRTGFIVSRINENKR
ncbi:MAG TPA: STAS domain-containing protein [Candidatus Binataceae bacterium]|nr:STAS domain-containing protein [Candidatus Binataceae bacterium]